MEPQEAELMRITYLEGSKQSGSSKKVKQKISVSGMQSIGKSVMPYQGAFIWLAHVDGV